MAVVVGKIFVVLIVVRSNSSVGAELGEIVLSVVVALDCGRCTGVVLLVNDSLPKKGKINIQARRARLCHLIPLTPQDLNSNSLFWL